MLRFTDSCYAWMFVHECCGVIDLIGRCYLALARARLVAWPKQAEQAATASNPPIERSTSEYIRYGTFESAIPEREARL